MKTKVEFSQKAWLELVPNRKPSAQDVWDFRREATVYGNKAVPVLVTVTSLPAKRKGK